MTVVELPLWAEITVAALALLSASIALVCSIGLLRLRHFFERVHLPAITSTLGCWCMVAASIVFFSAKDGRLTIFPILIAIFMGITVPISTIFLMRASLFRARQMEKSVPPSINNQTRPDVWES
jgi:multicomponent K+:H+ antiporter subunit G